MKRRDMAALALLLCLLAAFTAATARAARMSGETEDEPSAEHLLYIEAQEQTPQTWEELETVMAAEDGRCEAEDSRENENCEAALLARATKIENVTVTHYCICEKCCGKKADEPGYGVTASGRTAAPGVSVAVDPKLIPLGSDVLVDYGDGVLHYYRADDTGGAVKGAHIDLCMESHEAALAAGVKKGVTLWWAAPEEG